MPSLDEIINATVTEGIDLIINTNSTIDGTNKNNANKDASSNRELLFTFNETIPIDGLVAYDGIYYLDKTKTYIPTRQLGKYILKNHQLTTLYYMLGLEKMLFDIKRIVKDPQHDSGAAAAAVKPVIELITTHYTNVGVISDKVGAGKSYCVMALINEAKTFHTKQLPFRNATFGCNEIKTQDFKRLDTNILLVPHGLMGQWNKYLKDSGLKYYTVQKAKDVFGLADNTCEFKGKTFSMIAKEDDEIIIDNDNGDEDLDEEHSDIESISSKSSNLSTSNKTKSGKTKSTASTTATDPTIKKKKVSITKRTKAEADVIEAKQKKKQQAEASADVEANTVDASTKTEPTKAEMEKEKRKLRNEYEKIQHKYHIKISFHTQQGYSYYSPEATKDRQDAELLKQEMDAVYKKIDAINFKIKKLDLQVGAIKITEIQCLHAAFKINSLQFLNANLVDFVEKLGHLDKQKTEKYDVILVSATFWNLFTLYINQDKYTVNRIIIDECNAIKGNRLVEVPRLFTWLITSSISSMMTNSGYSYKQVLQPGGYYLNVREKTINSTGFILDMIKELYEHQSENYKIFLVNNPEYIEQSMTLPEMKTILVISRDSVNIQVLQGVVSHDVLQMLNAGDINGIIIKLDVAVADENNVVEMITRKYQDDLKVKEYELKIAVANPKYDPKHETIGVINKRKAIDDLKHKIACIEERVREVENCPICYDDFMNPAITPCCSNKFCFNCIAAALNSKTVCPMCKMELSIPKLIMISDKTKDEIKNTQKEKETTGNKLVKQPTTYDALLEQLQKHAIEYSKYENMDKIFELNAQQPVKKYLIFTEYESTLNTRITSILDKWGLTYGRIRGSSTAINNMVQTYKKADDELNILLINSKYFGSGLNLENTTDIIIIHKMHADIEMQVIGRAQRYGRVGNLRVWKLYYQNEISN